MCTDFRDVEDPGLIPKALTTFPQLYQTGKNPLFAYTETTENYPQQVVCSKFAGNFAQGLLRQA